MSHDPFQSSSDPVPLPPSPSLPPSLFRTMLIGGIIVFVLGLFVGRALFPARNNIDQAEVEKVPSANTSFPNGESVGVPPSNVSVDTGTPVAAPVNTNGRYPLLVSMDGLSYTGWTQGKVFGVSLMIPSGSEIVPGDGEQGIGGTRSYVLRDSATGLTLAELRTAVLLPEGVYHSAGDDRVVYEMYSNTWWKLQFPFSGRPPKGTQISPSHSTHGGLAVVETHATEAGCTVSAYHVLVRDDTYTREDTYSPVVLEFLRRVCDGDSAPMVPFTEEILKQVIDTTAVDLVGP